MVVKVFLLNQYLKTISLKQSKNYLKKNPSISNDIPISIIKNFTTCYCEKLASIFNDSLKENKFPNLMKTAEKSFTTPLKTTIGV